VETTRKAVAAARRAGIEDSSLMVIARHDIQLDELRTASIDKTDAVPGLERGLALGGIVGTLAGLLVLAVEEVGVALGGAALPLFALFGVGAGGLAGFLAGASVRSSRLRRFEQAIDQEGRILLLIDVPQDRVDAMEKLMKSEIPGIEFAGLEPHAPVIPW
jgi:hypothetical protein